MQLALTKRAPFTINWNTDIVFNGTVYWLLFLHLGSAQLGCSVWPCQVSNYAELNGYKTVPLKMLRELKRSQLLSASGMHGIVSLSRSYLAVKQNLLPRQWQKLFPNTSSRPWLREDGQVNSHKVLLYWPSKHQTIQQRESSLRQDANTASGDEKRCSILIWRLQTIKRLCYCVTLILQIFLWEQNLEQFHMDLFRFRCYLASLQGGELPNPKRLLAFASRPTKLAMGRLGIFSVSSFHALVNILLFAFSYSCK